MKTTILSRVAITAVLALVGTVSAQTTSKTEAITYHDSTANWVLGQTATVTCVSGTPSNTACDNNPSNGSDVVSATTYHVTTALPLTATSFGKLQSTVTYNADGTLATVKDGNNRITTLSNWKRGVPQTISFADSTLISAYVDDNGRIGWLTDENGYKTCYGYDAMGRVNLTTYTSETTAGVCDTTKWSATSRTFVPVAASEYGIAAGHWRETVTTGNATKITYYDAMWRPLLVREYDASDIAGTERFTKRAYDTEGRVSFAGYPVSSATFASQQSLAAQQGGDKGVTTFYEPLGRVSSTSQDSELGLLTTLITYGTGFTTTVTNPRGFSTTSTYQTYDQPSTDWPLVITAPEGATTTIFRDIFGKPKSVTRSGGGVTPVVREYAYNNQQELIRSQEPETGATIYGYDAGGNLSFSAAGLPMGANWSTGYPSSITRGYDARNRLSTLNFPDGKGSQVWTYTPDGLPSTISTNNGGSTVTNGYTYNKRRLLSGESMVPDTVQLGWGMGYGYDNLGQVTAETYPASVSVNYTVNALGQTKQITASSDGGAATTIASGGSYFPNGALKQFTYGNGIVHTMTQNARQLPSQSVDGTILNLTTTFDANGNVSAITDGTAAARQTRSMVYDQLDRLTSATSPMFGTASYEYDTLDNLKKAGIVGALAPNDAANRIHYYCYNAANQLTFVRSGSNCSSSPSVINISYDLQGNLLQKTGATGGTYTFDYGNRLRTVVGPSAPTQTYNYRYDADGRRVRHDVSGTSLKYSYYAKDGRLVWQRDEPGSKRISNIYFAGSLVAEYSRPIGAGAVTVSYQHTDALGSLIVKTSSSGAEIQTSEYEPFGDLLNRPNDDRAGYTGHVMDAASGLTYMQQRYYDPMIGQFLSVDPVTAYQKPTTNFNRYVYALNNPYRFTDPDGRDSTGEIIDSAAMGCGVVSCAGWAITRAVWDVFGAEGVSQVYDKGAGASAGDKLSAVLEVATLGKGKTAAKVGEVIADAGRGAARNIGKLVSGACSFDGSTLVMTDQGLLPIVEIKPGDVVLSFNEKTGAEGFNKVLDHFSEWHEATLSIEIMFAGTKEIIITTADHPVFILGEGFVPADELQLGDKVRLSNDNTAEITGLTTSKNGQVAYNLSVENDHTYFVGSSEILVHNNCRVRGLNTPKFNTGEMRQLAKALGLEKAGKSGELDIYRNPNGSPAYLVPSTTSHKGDVFKGFDTLKEAENAKPGKAFRNGSYDENLKYVGK